MSDENYLTLKWGTLKAWNVKGIDGVLPLLQEYHEIGAADSVILQEDTPRQQEIICELIDLMPCDIHLDWENKHVSKDAAKKYVMEYGKKD